MNDCKQTKCAVMNKCLHCTALIYSDHAVAQVLTTNPLQQPMLNAVQHQQYRGKKTDKGKKYKMKPLSYVLTLHHFQPNVKNIAKASGSFGKTSARLRSIHLPRFIKFFETYWNCCSKSML